MLVAVGTAALLSGYFTGSVVPTSQADALMFQSSLLFVVLGSAILEHRGQAVGDTSSRGTPDLSVASVRSG